MKVKMNTDHKDPSEDPYEHSRNENSEQEIIRNLQKKSNIAHDFDDCGTLSKIPEDFSIRVFDFNKDNSIRDALRTFNGPFSDAFFTLHLNKNNNINIDNQIELLNNWLKLNNVYVRKGDTTFASGNTYGVLVLAKENNFVQDSKFETIGSIDAVVSGKHFIVDQDLTHSGFYSSCAAISDIGANAGVPNKLKLLLINPPKDKNRFVKGVIEAAKYCKVKKILPIEEVYDSNLGDFSAIFTVIGSVSKGQQTTLRGLEDKMNIYVAGQIGLSSANNYNIPKEHLMINLNPTFRQKIFSKFTSKALASDVSDGFHKSVSNFLRYANNLGIVIYEKELLKAGSNSLGISVTLDNIKYGGDDYCLVIATKDTLHGKNIYRVGEVCSGEKKVVYV